MRRSLFAVPAAVLLALMFAGCASPQPGRGAGGRQPAQRSVVVVLINAPGGGGGCKALAAANTALTSDHVTWKVYNFCSSATGQTIEVRWDNAVAPTKNTNQLHDTVADSNSNPVKFASLMMNVDNWTAGTACSYNSSAWCFHYTFWLTPSGGGTPVQLPEDPDFEVDP